MDSSALQSVGGKCVYTSGSGNDGAKKYRKFFGERNTILAILQKDSNKHYIPEKF